MRFRIAHLSNKMLFWHMATTHVVFSLMTGLEFWHKKTCTVWKVTKSADVISPVGLGKWSKYGSITSQMLLKRGMGKSANLKWLSTRIRYIAASYGKATISHRKFVSLPRLGLTAAVLSSKCGKFIKKELQLECT